MLHLTPEMLVAAYELLRTTPPFKRWKLPEADDIEFHVTSDNSASGQYTYARTVKTVLWHRIEISNVFNKTLSQVLETMAHEMCHLRQRSSDRCTRSLTHGPKFKRLAAQVCRRHGFDEAAF